MKKYYCTKKTVKFSGSCAVFLPKQWTEFKPGDVVTMEVYPIDDPNNIIRIPYKTIICTSRVNALYCNKDWGLKPGTMVTFWITKNEAMENGDPRIEA